MPQAHTVCILYEILSLNINSSEMSRVNDLLIFIPLINQPFNIIEPHL